MSDTPKTDALAALFRDDPHDWGNRLWESHKSLERKLRAAEDMIVIMEFDLRRLRNEARAALAMIRGE